MDTIDRTGFMGIVRFNHLQPPFDNPAIRQAALGAINQTDLVIAVAGSDPSAWDDKVGVFCPESPMANNAGLDVLTSKRTTPASSAIWPPPAIAGKRSCS